MPDSFNPTHCFWCEKDISTDRANFGWNVIDHDNPFPLMDCVDDLSLLILTRAAFDSASHHSLLCVGLTHLGKRGSYTVMITNIG